MNCAKSTFQHTSGTKTAPFLERTFGYTSRSFRHTSKGLFGIHQDHERWV